MSILVNLGLIVLLQEYKKEFLYITAYGNYKKYVNVYAALLIKLKFDMCIIGHRSLYYINFGVNRIYRFFTEYSKCHTLRRIGSKYFFHFSIIKLLEPVCN